MNKGFNKAFGSLLTSASIVAALTVAITGGGARAATPTSNAPASPDASWQKPINASQSGGFYNNTGTIAASQTTGAVTIAWTRTVKNSTEAYITQASNDAAGSANFTQQNTWKGQDQQMGNVRSAHDSLGNRHVAFWALKGGTVGEYFMVDGNGHATPAEEVPGTAGTNRKNVAIAVGPDNSVHVLFGRNLENIYYYHRTPQGVWDVQGEQVPTVDRPTDMSIAVSSQGKVMVAFKDTALTGANADIYTATRIGPDQWSELEDPSAPCCNGCPYDSHTYLPQLAPDQNGGIRMAWSDENCDIGQQDPTTSDIYYREWKANTGWEGSPIVQVVRNSGQSYYPALAVDGAGVAHISWSDYTSSPFNYFRVFYSEGSGTTFSHVEVPADPWFPGSYQKESDIDTSPNGVHVSFSSDRDNPQKEVYYQYRPGSVAPPAPPCPNEQFKDVCADSPFYQAILALNSQGVLSGYNTSPPCDYSNWTPCFRPNDNMTRQQTAKVIVLAFKVPTNLRGAPHFTDVNSSSPFYNYIESAYNAGIISGYSDHTFRPLNTVTRGQLSKMVSQAAGFNDAVSGQSYQDVTTSNSFYSYIERLSRRNIISGYQCGGPGEPCVAPNNRPYFRPGSPVTRGQAAKIIYGAQQANATATPVPPTSTSTATPSSTSTPTRTATNTATATNTSVIPPIP